MPSAAPGSIHAMIQPSHVLRNDQTLITSCTIRTGSSSAAAVAGGSTNAAKGVASAPTPASPPFAMPSITTATTRIASVAGSADMLMRRISCFGIVGQAPVDRAAPVRLQKRVRLAERPRPEKAVMRRERRRVRRAQDQMRAVGAQPRHICRLLLRRSEEHTSELQSLMRTSYDVFCL